MSFQVLYRRWRPRRFSELVGQDHVATTLRQTVHRGRVAHSYLFCGPRGTGKTSSARVLAKAINCLNPSEGDPCDECTRCVSINESRFMDLIELDAASNRGIDEIRNIRDKINLAPVEGTHKVYIIDEAHMLTEHASNAFLKTLEEPPPHATFVLCTTESHKILPTIISRCQRFDFRRIAWASIVQRLRRICSEEGIDADDRALEGLARLAEGSLRDAENLLEQLSASSDGRIGAEEVYDLLGLGTIDRALELMAHLTGSNAAGALATINRAAWDGADVRQLYRQTLELMRAVLLLQCGAGESVDLPGDTVEQLERLRARVSTETLLASLKILGAVDLRHDALSSLPLELAAVEVCEMVGRRSEPDAAPALDNASPPAATVAPPTAPREDTPLRVALEKPAPPELAASSGVADHGAEVESPVPWQSAPVPHPGPIPEGGAVDPESVQSAPEVRTGSDDLDPVTELAAGTEALEPVTALAAGSEALEPLDLATDSFQERWSDLVRTLSRHKGRRFNIGALLRGCKSQNMEGDTLVLGFAHRSHMERMQEELDDPQGMRTIRDAMTKSLGASYLLTLKLLDGASGANGPSKVLSPLVRTALGMGARIIEERDQ